MFRRALPALLMLAGCAEADQRRDDRPRPVRIELGAVRAAIAPLPAPATVPLAWTHAASARSASLAPGDGAALLTLGCEGWERGAPRLVVVRHAPAEPGAQALLAIQGSKGVLRLPVAATRLGAPGRVWRGELAAGDPRAEVLLGNGLKATVPGGGELLLPPLGEAAAVVRECLAEPQTLPNLASNPATSPAAR